ncbi:MAG: Lrp/AsnC family transcriptional regulator [Rhizobiaceae bacterium]
MKKLDDFDRTILRLLQKDASLSIDALAERVALSRNACWRRVKNLEEVGVIKGRVALVDAEAVDLGLSVFVMVKTNEHDSAWLEEFRKVVIATPEITGAFRMSGDLDYLLRVSIGNVKAYDAFYQRFTRTLKMSDISASFVMEEIKDTTALPV